MPLQSPSRKDFARRWKSVASRNAQADGTFVYAVRTTGVYCRPSCPSRMPSRKNVEFFDAPVEAERAGYRACRRCRPANPASGDEWAGRLSRACRLIDESLTALPLAAIAACASVSPRQLNRLFRERLGVTPREYAAARRAERLKAELATGAPLAASTVRPSRTM